MIKKVFPILALSIFVSSLGVGIIIPLLPLYAEKMGASALGIGIIFAGYAITNVIATPLIGRLSDRKGRKIFIAIGLFGYAVIALGFVWADNVLYLTLVRLVQGVAGAFILPIAQAYIGDVSPNGEEGKWMGYYNAINFTGFGCGPLMGGLLTDHFGTYASFYAMGALNLLAFLIVVFLLPEVTQEKVSSDLSLSVKEMSASSMVRGLFSFQFTVSIGQGAFTTFLPIFASISIGLSPSLIGVLLAINMLLSSLLQFYAGHLADRLNRSILLAVSSFFIALSFGLIPFGNNFWQLLMIGALGGIAGAIAGPAAAALTVEEGRRFGMGSTIAIMNIAMSLGFAVGPVLGGSIVDVGHVDPVFYFGAIIGIIGTVLFVWFAQQKAKSK